MTSIKNLLPEKLNFTLDAEDVDAAVALLLKPENEGFSVLFVKRVRSRNDPWSGQMALPGGKREPNDRNLKQTVMRETLEETSINLENRCRFLGTTSIQLSGRKHEMRILPFVILLEYEPVVKLNKNELEQFVWISLKQLTCHRGTVRTAHGRTPAYVIDGHVIWGLTYRIVEEFLHAVNQ